MLRAGSEGLELWLTLRRSQASAAVTRTICRRCLHSCKARVCPPRISRARSSYNFGSEALLRSLAVAPECRRRGIGHQLVARLEHDAYAGGIQRLILLTETAQAFFRALDYQVIDRQAVGDAVKQSAEFRSLCPASAVCMSKTLQS